MQICAEGKKGVVRLFSKEHVNLLNWGGGA